MVLLAVKLPLGRGKATAGGKPEGNWPENSPWGGEKLSQVENPKGIGLRIPPGKLKRRHG